MTQYRDLALDVILQFSSYTIQTLPRKNNRHANTMASATPLVCLENNAKNFQFTIQNLKNPVISKKITSNCFNLHSDEWYSHIFHFFKDGTFPELTTRNTCNHIRKLATHYIIIGDMLYKRTYEGLLLRCLNRTEIPVALAEAHSSSCGGHC